MRSAAASGWSQSCGCRARKSSAIGRSPCHQRRVISAARSEARGAAASRDDGGQSAATRMGLMGLMGHMGLMIRRMPFVALGCAGFGGRCRGEDSGAKQPPLNNCRGSSCSTRRMDMRHNPWGPPEGGDMDKLCRPLNHTLRRPATATGFARAIAASRGTRGETRDGRTTGWGHDPLLGAICKICADRKDQRRQDLGPRRRRPHLPTHIPFPTTDTAGARRLWTGWPEFSRVSLMRRPPGRRPLDLRRGGSRGTSTRGSARVASRE
jgi:hypothetical protein